jgi:hypothetical protein
MGAPPDAGRESRLFERCTGVAVAVDVGRLRVFLVVFQPPVPTAPQCDFWTQRQQSEDARGRANSVGISCPQLLSVLKTSVADLPAVGGLWGGFGRAASVARNRDHGRRSLARELLLHWRHTDLGLFLNPPCSSGPKRECYHSGGRMLMFGPPNIIWKKLALG